MATRKEEVPTEDRIYVGAEEKVGFPNYSNMVYSASISRNVPTGKAALETLREAASEVEEYMAEQREVVNELYMEAVKNS